MRSSKVAKGSIMEDEEDEELSKSWSNLAMIALMSLVFGANRSYTLMLDSFLFSIVSLSISLHSLVIPCYCHLLNQPKEELASMGKVCQMLRILLNKIIRCHVCTGEML